MDVDEGGNKLGISITRIQTTRADNEFDCLPQYYRPTPGNNDQSEKREGRPLLH